MSSPGFSFSQAHLAEIATDILKHAKKHGASACETDVSEGFGQSVAVRKGEVDTIEYNRDKGVGVTVYVGQQRGYASTSDFSKKALKATVEAALSIARFTAPDPCAGLADAALMAKPKDMPELDLFHPWQIDVGEAIALWLPKRISWSSASKTKSPGGFVMVRFLRMMLMIMAPVSAFRLTSRMLLPIVGLPGAM